MALYKDRKEQREVNETMSALLNPLYKFVTPEKQEIFMTALRILSETRIEKEVEDE